MNTQSDMLKSNFRYFLLLMQAVVNDTDAPETDESINWQLLYEIAVNHSLGGMLYYAIQKLPENKRPEGEFMPYLAQMYREQIVADLNLSFETERILTLLSNEGIRCLPVKGIVTKADYPEPHLRSMTDVDILIDADNRLKVEKLFLNNGYVKENTGDKDIAYRKDEILHFEMHHALLSESSPAYSYFSKIWERVSFRDDSLVALMNPEDAYIFMLEHLAVHMESGGAGIRMLIDIYLFNKKHESELDRVYVSNVLKDILLDDFEKSIVKLCENWFSGKYEPDVDSGKALFILNSCTFGKTEISFLADNIKNFKESTSASNGFKRIIKKLFPSVKWMKLRFKAVDKLPLLYPVFIPVHWADRLILKRNVNTANLGSYFTSADSDEAKALKAVYTSLGLKKRI